MKILYVGHACFLVEIGGCRILMDPWIVGSTYYHAWWHVPPVTATPEELGPIDLIMISHVHDDHFHLPTLKRLPKTAAVVLPYTLDRWMAQTVKGMGFPKVVELEHGAGARLRDNLWVENFHFGRLDSAFWLRSGDQTLLNLNDCAVPTEWLRRWRRVHPAPAVTLGTFSYASAYPLCYEIPGMNRKEMAFESIQRYLEQFAENMSVLGSRTVIPIATQYGFLAEDQWWMNDFVPTPLQALAALEQRDRGVQGILLNPGDQFSTTEGLRRTGPLFDWTKKAELIPRLAAQRRGEIRDALEGEPQPPEDWFEEFRAYFDPILRRNPLIRKRIGVPVVFMLEPRGPRWVIDFSRSAAWVRRGEETDPPAPIEIHLPQTLLYAAVRGEIHWENLYGSNRLTVKVRRELLGAEWEFWRTLFNFRDGLFQDRIQMLTPRGLRILMRRRNDLVPMFLERLHRPSSREPLMQERSS